MSRAFLPFIGVWCLQQAWGCTIIAVGREASATGRPMVAHTDDGGAEPSDVRFVRVPRRSWPEHSRRPLHDWGQHYPRVVNAERAPDYAPIDGQAETPPLTFIPQVAETNAYWDMDYGVQNEHGLSMAESTCAARTAGWPARPGTNGHCRVGIEDLSKLGMERCSTARCAVQVMGQVAVEQGFYSADSGDSAAPDYEDSSEALMLADAEDLWIFNVMTGPRNASAIWAAQRVDPGHVAAVANMFTIRRIDLNDAENFLYSPNVTGLAQEMGWWSPADDESGFFSWSRVYGYPFLEDGGLFNSGRRLWRVYSILSPEEGAKLDPEKGDGPQVHHPFPPSVPVARGSVTAQMVMSVLRDHYEGTPYDLTAGMAAGPFGTPNRAGSPAGVVGSWERAISPQQSSFSFVAEAGHGLQGVVWLGLDRPHGTAFLPFLGAASEPAPTGYSSHDGSQSKFSTDVSWWAFNVVNQYSDLNFQLINADVRKRAQEVEERAVHAVDACRTGAEMSSSPLASATSCLNSFVSEEVRRWWEYAFSLFAKYGRYAIALSESDAKNQVYPEWWLRSPDVGFTTWHKGGPFHGGPCVATSSTEAHHSVDQALSSYPLASREVPIAEATSGVPPWLVAALAANGAVAAVAGVVGYRWGRRVRDVPEEIVAGYIRVA